MKVTPLYHLLSQEGFITQSCISTGLTEIRNANLGERGRYYTAFFQLSIGLERMAKLALILDHMIANHLAPPGGATIRNYGHNIEKLYAAANAVAARRGWQPANDLPTSPFADRIRAFLTNFANGARYANLDALASGNPGPEPLVEWAQILDEILDTDVPIKKRVRIEWESAALGYHLRNAAIVQGHDLARQPLSLEDWFAKPRLLDEAARHVVWHIVLIVAPLKEIICSLTHEAIAINLQQSTAIVQIPHLQEYFTFLWVDRKYVLRKKRWP